MIIQGNTSETSTSETSKNRKLEGREGCTIYTQLLGIHTIADSKTNTTHELGILKVKQEMTTRSLGTSCGEIEDGRKGKQKSMRGRYCCDIVGHPSSNMSQIDSGWKQSPI